MSKDVMLCDDLDCKFKQKHRGSRKKVNECMLNLAEAKEFYNKYGFTTCELGTGEQQARPEEQSNEVFINALKYKGVVR